MCECMEDKLLDIILITNGDNLKLFGIFEDNIRESLKSVMY